MNTAAWVGMLAGVAGTGIGGLAGFVLRHPSRKLISSLISFAAGLMLSVVAIDLLPEAFRLGGLTATLPAICAGALLIWLAERRTSLASSSGDSLRRSGLLVVLGIALHNLPEGLVIGAQWQSDPVAGLATAVIIALHDIPEGLAMAVPLRAGGMNPWKVLGLVLLSGIPTGIGSIIGSWLGELSPGMLCACLGFAGGAMAWLTLNELLPQSARLYSGWATGIGLLIGAVLGVLLIAV